ncbi:MAG: PIN domain-containing protein [Chloroflexi bacterium]|nr:PIN domain-containing protein [Chloroflexota bacterium]
MILLDTDVLIDIALDRRPHSEPASELLDLLERGLQSAYIAWHTVSNFYYLVASSRGGENARDFIVDLTRFVRVAPTDTDAVHYAAGLPMADFEDALQVAAARSCGAQYIVTRNVKDFARSPIPAMSPREALAQLN